MTVYPYRKNQTTIPKAAVEAEPPDVDSSYEIEPDVGWSLAKDRHFRKRGGKSVPQAGWPGVGGNDDAVAVGVKRFKRQGHDALDTNVLVDTDDRTTRPKSESEADVNRKKAKFSLAILWRQTLGFSERLE